MNFTVNILGTASAKPTTSRYPSAQVLNVRGRLFMIDCGEASQMQMIRMGISPLKIEAIFVSHLHGDHIFGIFGLLSTMTMLGRKTTLRIFAPRDFAGILDFYKTRFGDGLNFEISHIVLEMDSPETILDTPVVYISAIPLRHRIDAFGFIFSEKEPLLNVHKDAIPKYGLTPQEITSLKQGEDVVRQDGNTITCAAVTYKPFKPRSYAYCSDTAPFPELTQWVRGVDLLYHEATFPNSMAEMAQTTNHSTTSQAAQCALDAGVGKLIVGHYSSRFTDLNPFLAELRAIFPESYLTNEGDIFEIPLHRLPEK